MSRPAFISGRKPKPYQVGNGYYACINGKQMYNRALYGSISADGYHRFRVFGGDVPEFLVYLPGDAGRLFFCMEAGGVQKKLSDFSYIEMEYHCGWLRYKMRDDIFKGCLTLSVVPLHYKNGMAVKLETEELQQELLLHAYYGCASGSVSDRAMDAGYYNSDDSSEGIPFTSDGCNGNLFSCGGIAFSMKAPITGEKEMNGCFTYSGAFSFIEAIGVEKGEYKSCSPDSEENKVLCYSSCITGDFAGYLVLELSDAAKTYSFEKASELFAEAVAHCEKVNNTASAATPDKRLNTALKACCTAAEGMWIPPVFAHGAWSWDLPLMGWRSMYGPVVLGWHERVREEARFFTSMQLKDDQNDCGWCRDKKKPLSAPDPVFNLARQSSNSIFVSEGMMPYTRERPDRVIYNMQEVFMDELIYEYLRTGDRGFAEEIFPVLKRHIAWEKKCFDADNDGLYENYANYWASDAVFASGAGCALASAYNYRANIAAGELAEILGEDPSPFYSQADRIRKAVKDKLWIENEGHLAECLDTYGERLLHTSLSLPTIVHCAESGILDKFELYQMLKYTENSLERQQVEGGELIWNTNWVPYLWSVRDIDYADVFHAALAYFSIGQEEQGCKLLFGAMEDTTCRSVSPGAFTCTCDGKCIDFADSVSMFARSVIEGLFGINPKMHKGQVYISPNFPRDWKEASISTTDYSCEYRCQENAELLKVDVFKACTVKIRIKARKNVIKRVLANGVAIPYTLEAGIGQAYICVESLYERHLSFEIVYGGKEAQGLEFPGVIVSGYSYGLSSGELILSGIYDPQKVIERSAISAMEAEVVFRSRSGWHTVFIKVKDAMLEYWQPLNLKIRESLEISEPDLSIENRTLQFRIVSYIKDPVALSLRFDGQTESVRLDFEQAGSPVTFRIPDGYEILPGLNRFDVLAEGQLQKVLPVCVNVEKLPRELYEGFYSRCRTIDIKRYFNDRLADIFKHDYLSPRSPFCSLQVPKNLYPPDWCVVNTQGIEGMDDSLLRNSIINGIFNASGIPFTQCESSDGRNVCYVSKWDNFPSEAVIPVNCSGRKAYLLLTGYTNQMQCRVVNARIELLYQDGSSDLTDLVHPFNFRSMVDGPGTEREEDRYCYGDTPLRRVKIGIKNSSATEQEADNGIYAQVLDVDLRPCRLDAIKIKAVANDVVIGLMGISVIA